MSSSAGACEHRRVGIPCATLSSMAPDMASTRTRKEIFELRRRLQDGERAAWLELFGALRAEVGNVTRAAGKLRIPERTLQNWRGDFPALQDAIAIIRNAADRAAIAEAQRVPVPEPWADAEPEAPPSDPE